METGMPGLASAPANAGAAAAAQAERRMDARAPLMAVYIPALHPRPPPPAPAGGPAPLRLAAPLYSVETLPFLTLRVAAAAGGPQPPAASAPAAASPSARAKAAGRHVCPHCRRDCMKPSVLEKHLRCHTGERPYPCATCGISFKTQSNLYKHRRTQAHARLSSESDHSCPGSLDSASGSVEALPSGSSLEESRGTEEEDATRPSEPSPADHQAKGSGESAGVAIEAAGERTEGRRMSLRAGRHLPLRRQEATLFCKQWEGAASDGKAQSHESTDSGFSESSDLHPSPGSFSLDHGADSLAESTEERLGQIPDAHAAREREQKTLEERISRLISENTAVVEDRRLENARPRKTVLSKQGSIDLPMPYTYKDSFHFDMRISRTQAVGLQRTRVASLGSSASAQRPTAAGEEEDASLVRSHSLPFSVALAQPERSHPATIHQSDYLTLDRTRSSGQVDPTGLTSKPVSQQTSAHRPLVRQVAVDCNPAEEASAAGLGRGEPSNRKARRKKTQKFAYNKWYVYGDGTFRKLYGAEEGGDDGGAVKGRKCSTNPEREVVRGSQKRSPADRKGAVATTGSAVKFVCSGARACHPEGPPAKQSHVSAADCDPKSGRPPTPSGSLTPLRKDPSLPPLPKPPIASPVNRKAGGLSRAEDGGAIKGERGSSSLPCEPRVPSGGERQQADDETLPKETDPSAVTHPPPSLAASAPRQTSNPTHVNLHDHLELKGVLFPSNTASFSSSTATAAPSASKTSFLPKYQLKLPGAAEPASSPSPRAAAKSSATDSDRVTSAPLVSSSMPSRPLLTLAATTALCQDGSSSLSNDAKSSSAVVQQRSATASGTTSCARGGRASIRPSKSINGGSEAVQLTRPSATVVANLPAAPAPTTASDQRAAATIKGQPNRASHTQLLPASDPSSPVDGPHVASGAPVTPWPAARDVYHVRTADLQICLQIISDEQLALIQPRIEGPAGGASSIRGGNAGRSKIHGRVEDHQHAGQEKEPDGVKPQLCERFGEEGRRQTPEEEPSPDVGVIRGGSASQAASGRPEREPEVPEGPTYSEGESESEESRSPPRDRPGRTSGAPRADGLSGSPPSHPINKCEAPGRLNPRTSVQCSRPRGPTPRQTSVSSDIQVEGPRGLPDIRGPTAGPPGGRAAQRDPRTRRHGGAPGGRRSARTKRRCPEGEGDGGTAGEEGSGRSKTAEEPRSCSQEATKPEAKMDSLNTLRSPEEHLYTTQSGRNPQQRGPPRRAPDTSECLRPPAPSGRGGFFHPPRASLEMSNSCFAVGPRRRPQTSSRRVETRGPSRAPSPAEPGPRQGFSISRATAELASGGPGLTPPDGRVPCSVRESAGVTPGPRGPNGEALRHDAPPPPPCPEAHAEDGGPNGDAGHEGHPGGSDAPDGRRSLSLPGPLRGPPEDEGPCDGGDPPEEGSSSDDEGKLVIEL